MRNWGNPVQRPFQSAGLSQRKYWVFLKSKNGGAVPMYAGSISECWGLAEEQYGDDVIDVRWQPAKKQEE